MIASENFTIPAVMETLGTVLQINMQKVIQIRDIIVVVNMLIEL